MFRSAKWVFPLFAAIVCSGCGIEPETIAKLQEAVKASTAQPNDLEPDAPVAETVEVAFSTPYPNRDDPFTFVSRASAPRDVGVVRPPTADNGATGCDSANKCQSSRPYQRLPGSWPWQVSPLTSPCARRSRWWGAAGGKGHF